MTVNTNLLKWFSTVPGVFTPGPSSSVATFSQALNTQYTFGSAGTAVAFFFASPSNGQLTDFNIYVSSVAGTGGDLSWELRLGQSGNAVPDSSVVASGTITGGNSTGFKTVSGLSVTLQAGGPYYLVIFDSTSDAATNNSTLRYAGIGSGSSAYLFVNTITAANGFSSAGTVQNRRGYMAMKINGVWYGSAHWDAVNTVTSGSYERGSRFKLPGISGLSLAGFSEVMGDICNSHAGQTIKLYDDSNNLLSTFYTFGTWPYGGTGPGSYAWIFDSGWYDLQPDTWYMLTYTPASSVTIPRKFTGPSSCPAGWMEVAMPFDGNCHWVDKSSGSWDKTQTTAMCALLPLLLPSGITGSPPNVGIRTGGRL